MPPLLERLYSNDDPMSLYLCLLYLNVFTPMMILCILMPPLLERLYSNDDPMSLYLCLLYLNVFTPMMILCLYTYASFT